MDYLLVVTPSGQIMPRAAVDGATDASSLDRDIKSVLRASGVSQAEGLFTLAAGRAESAWPPELVFWRDFSQRYLTELCHTPEMAGSAIEEIETPDHEELTEVLRYSSSRKAKPASAGGFGRS